MELSDLQEAGQGRQIFILEVAQDRLINILKNENYGQLPGFKVFVLECIFSGELVVYVQVIDPYFLQEIHTYQEKADQIKVL